MAFYGKCIGCYGDGHTINMCSNHIIMARRDYFSYTIGKISKKEDIYNYLRCLTVDNLRLVGSIENINTGIPVTMLLMELTDTHYNNNRKRRIQELNNKFKKLI